MPSPSAPLPAAGSLARHLGVMTSAGILCALPGVAHAGPSATVPDCLRPPQAITTAAASVLIPQGSPAPQLLAQALPATSPNRSSSTQSSSQVPASSQFVAQAAAPAAPPSLPACTYDPPMPEVIRGLW